MLSFFPRGVLDEIWDIFESVSEGFPSYSSLMHIVISLQNVISGYALTMHNTPVQNATAVVLWSI